ncbi:uncharacterized protein LOC117053410 isoform X1 [Lacerta agilis]|uniref:uncharacterized protein LOC117053410 isoform X1 n=1 Tax=Lacerta agilis TaxID=80427 RepID=UPI001419F91C|nr:uncharacterized protein LOC117053410 isoform X1 [Lacerta agilis]
MVKSKKKKNQQKKGDCWDYSWGPGGNMPPWMGGPCPDAMWGPGGNRPPWMGGPCPDDMWGPGGNRPPWMGGPCPGDNWGPGGNIAPCMGGRCPDDMWGPGGDMPPWMGGSCPDDTWRPGGDMSPWMRDPCPDDMLKPGGDTGMSPWTRDPCPDDTWQPRKRKHGKYMQPNMRDPCPNMGEPSEPMSSGPNAPDQMQCRTFGGPGKKQQPMDQCGTNSRENGPLPPGNCSSDQTAAGNASDTQRHYTEEGAARILSNFGLSTKDLEEFGHYSDEQLKPENMAMILRDIVERKKARQLPTSSQGKEEETSGGHGGSDSLMKTGPLVPSAAQPATTPAASVLPQSSVSPSLSMMNDYHAVSPTVLPHLCTLCQIECANMTGWNLHVGTTAHSEKCDQLRQQPPDWIAEDCSLLQRHEVEKQEKHIAMSAVPGHTRSRSRKRKRKRKSRASKRPCSPCWSSEMPSREKRQLGRSTTSPASSAEAGSSWQPPAKSDVAEQPPNKSEHPLQTIPGHQELPKKEAATQEQGDRQPPAKSDVAEEPPNKSDAQKLRTLPTPSMMNDYYAASPRIFPHVCSLCNMKCRHLKEWNLHVSTTAHSEKCDQLRQQHEGDKKEKHIPMPCSTTSNPNASQHSVPGHALSQTWSQSEKPRCRSRASKRPCSPSLSSQMPSSQKRKLGTSTTSPASSAEAGSSEHPLQTNPGHQELATMEAATQEQGDRQREDLLRLALRPLAEQSVMQALSLLQSGSAVGAGLTQGTSLTPLPPVQIDPASLSLVSLMQLVATQVVQTVLASQEVSCVQGSPGVAGPSPQLCIPAGREEKKQESSQRVVPGVAPSCSACVERPGASGSKGDLTPSTLSTVPWLQKKDARPPKQNLPAEIPAGLATKKVWICGHSIVYWAEVRAVSSNWGSNLGFPSNIDVSWIGQRGMRWHQLLPLLTARISTVGPPDIIIFQLGENDLGEQKDNDLIMAITEDLKTLHFLYPHTSLCWSELLDRQYWPIIQKHGIPDPTPAAVNRARSRTRKKVNRDITYNVQLLGGWVIRHPDITFQREALFRQDGIDLSDEGLDIWLADLVGGLKYCFQM